LSAFCPCPQETEKAVVFGALKGPVGSEYYYFTVKLIEADETSLSKRATETRESRQTSWNPEQE
jgi:hypothetical protein